ncbi:hypothetical protein ZIOFF_010735 [Zingiber officinale]|uniref:Uncharacterized protein n=1 Tax=Zingiber officinale TaxID=94328 RepID=A0A8J5LYJ2_ZINOF|nr:hypothetical protein ZIOFF_010735 [Zingiber officinale]
MSSSLLTAAPFLHPSSSRTSPPSLRLDGSSLHWSLPSSRRSGAALGIRAVKWEPSKVAPQADRVLIRLEELPEFFDQKSAGGVLLPKSAVKFERYLMGEILSVGSDVTEVEAGKKVLFSDINAYECLGVDTGLNGYLLIRMTDIQTFGHVRNTRPTASFVGISEQQLAKGTLCGRCWCLHGLACDREIYLPTESHDFLPFILPCARGTQRGDMTDSKKARRGKSCSIAKGRITEERGKARYTIGLFCLVHMRVNCDGKLYSKATRQAKVPVSAVCKGERS